jgi:hypothetical protein
MCDDMAPVCGKDKPVASIPMALAEEAHRAYVRWFGNCQSLKTLNSRGGFYPEELDCLLGGCNPIRHEHHTKVEKQSLRQSWLERASQAAARPAEGTGEG